LDVIREADLELVDAVQVNPRASWSAIGAALGISPLTAARRWHTLCDQGIAWSGSTMGPALFRGAFVELSCRPSATEDVLARLHAMPDVLTVGRTAGDFDLYAITVAPTPAALRSLLWDRIDRLDVVRKRAQVYTRVHGGPDWRLTVLNRSQTDQIREVVPRAPRQSPTTPADRALFLALAADARRTHADLAAELDSTPHAVRRQLDRLRRHGRIAFRADVARPPAGWPYAALLHLNVPDEQLHTVGRELGARPETRFCAAVAGPATMVLVVNVRAPEHLTDIVVQITAGHPGVTVADRSMILQLTKVNGRLLDVDGRSTGIVPVDPWFADTPLSATAR
jgi:DNA-binding Lrp family transcriptional regulator